MKEALQRMIYFQCLLLKKDVFQQCSRFKIPKLLQLFMGYHEGAFISEIPNIINEENVTIAPGQGKKVSILKF